MKQVMQRWRRLFIIASIAVAAGAGLYGLKLYGDQPSVYAASTSSNVKTLSISDWSSEEGQIEPYYLEQLEHWQDAGVPNGSKEISIAAAQYANKSEDAKLEVKDYEGKQDALIWSNQKGYVEYEVEVEQEGLYELWAHYYPLPSHDGGNRQPVLVSALINGQYPYNEARSIVLERHYRDVDTERYDEFGNQLRAQIEEMPGWKETAFRESNGSYALPLKWHLKQGKNTIRLQVLQQPLALHELGIRPAAAIPTYKEVLSSYPQDGLREGEPLIIEAEHYHYKNSTSIQNVYDRDPATKPSSAGKIAYNTLGGSRWMKGSQTVSWSLDVPEDGFYKLAMRANQSTVKNMSVFRSIYIDGNIPFQEMEQVQFPYDANWRGVTLSDSDGQPYAFYLTKGEHTLSMEAHYEPYMPMIIEMDHISKELRSILLELRMATGNREDKYRVWNVEKDIPGLIERMERIREQFIVLEEQMKSINPKTDNVAQMLKNGAADMKSILSKPNEIPYAKERIATVQESLESNRSLLMDAPLQLDQLLLAPVDAKLPSMTSNIWQKTGGMFQSLFYSFKDRSTTTSGDEDVLDVWMVWGRDYVDELQRLVNDRFTPETGIKVHINLIQNPQLLTLANASGMMPDVALGVPVNIPFDMALRNAALDLSKLEGAEQFFSRFNPGMLQPLYYDGGYYGVPETVRFKVLFYRKDILNQLDLEVPDTWDDIYKMLPTLLQNHYNFYMDPVDYTPIMFQNNVDMYTKTGLKTGLDTPDAFKSYKMWTDFYNVQGLERVVQSFYNQFRRGDIPIGISDFNMYIQLLVAAPEIANDWAIAPIPGTKQDDNSMIRWSGGSNPTNAMLFKSSRKEKQEEAWKFLQWYMSTEIQTEFGLNLEQYYGETFRWNTANVEAFARMPWKPEDLSVILEQWKWTKEVPQVPGGYMTDRELGFAWNRTVVDSENSRISLEKAIKEINRELARKQQEFDIIGPNGEVLKPLELPDMEKPWEGVDEFVE